MTDSQAAALPAGQLLLDRHRREWRGGAPPPPPPPGGPGAPWPPPDAPPPAVRTDPTGRPCYLRGDRLVGDLQVVSQWVVDVDWWDRPVSREYWRVILRERLLCEIYRDRDQQAWFVERIYD